MEWIIIIICLILFWIVQDILYKSPIEHTYIKEKENIKYLEQDLFHLRLYLSNLACRWEPKNLQFISSLAKQEYMQSGKWKKIRFSRLKIAQHKCEYCGSTHKLECHHITYKRLTQEHIEDLVILCGGLNGCHQKIHDILGTDRTEYYPISILKKNK